MINEGTNTEMLAAAIDFQWIMRVKVSSRRILLASWSLVV
jgi:hypothetical protein